MPQVGNLAFWPLLSNATHKIASVCFKPGARLAASVAVLALVLGPVAKAQPVGSGEWVSGPCSGHGYSDAGRCFCDPRWSGAACDTPDKPLDCGEHGAPAHGWCVCEPGWKGRACQIAPLHCTHGKVAHGKCVCDPGWSGDACNTGS